MNEIQTIVAEMPHNAKVVLFVIATLERLRGRGLVEGGRPLTEQGRSAAEELARQGFQPTEDEMQSVLAFLMREDGDADKETT